MPKKKRTPLDLKEADEFIDILEMERQEGNEVSEQMRAMVLSEDMVISVGAVWRRAKKGCE